MVQAMLPLPLPSSLASPSPQKMLLISCVRPCVTAASEVMDVTLETKLLANKEIQEKPQSSNSVLTFSETGIPIR